MYYKAIKTKLKLNNCQATLMAKHAGFAKWVYNWGLRLWREGYKEGIKPSANILKKFFTNHVKPQFSWMSELSSRVYQYAFLALGDAFKRFFKKLGVLKLARQHRRVAAIRNDAIQKITSYLAQNHSRIVIEDLNVVGLLKNHKLAGAIADCGFSEFRRQMEYKCSRYGSQLLIADRFYPSSQLCSCCGYRQKMPLKARVYECINCELSIGRDLNAAINLCNWGRLVPGSLLTVNRSHAPVEAESKPQCPDLSDVVSVL